MKLYKNSSMDAYYVDEEADLDQPCEVHLGGGEIVVSTRYDDEFVVYRGKEVEEGHFRLEAPTKGGRGTLHRFRDADILEGFWSEGRSYGMWRITLRG